MRPLIKPLAVLAVPAVALTLAACGADVEIGDQVAVENSTITADGHTYKVTDLQINGSDATAKTEDGKTLTFHKEDGHWSVVKE